MINSSILKTGPKTKLFASLAMSIIAFMAIYNWAISPQTAYISAAQHYEQVAKNTEQKTAVLETTVKHKQAELAELQISFSKAKEAFFDSQSALEFLSNIESLATKAGCTVDSSNITALGPIKFEGAESSELIVVPKQAEIRLTGQYDCITEFIKQLSTNEKKVSLSNLDIKTTPDYMALTCIMCVTIYTIEDKEIRNDVKN